MPPSAATTKFVLLHRITGNVAIKVRPSAVGAYEPHGVNHTMLYLGGLAILVAEPFDTVDAALTTS